MRSSMIVTAGLLASAALAGCPFVTSGIGGVPGTGGGGGGGAGGSGTTSTACKASTDTIACYGGPPNTAGLGLCKQGTAICNADGTGYGPCMGDVTPAADNCASRLNAHCDLTETPCKGTPIAGGKTTGGPGDDRALAVAIDSLGNALVAGFFHGMLDFGDGMPLHPPDMGSDGFVAKYDPAGKLVWVVQLGDNGDDQATAITVDANDNVYVGGAFAQKIAFQTMPTATTVMGGPGIFVAKLDKDGHAQWGKGYVGGAAKTAGISLSADGATLAVAGSTSGNLTVGGKMLSTQNGNDTDGFLFTIDSGGTLGGWVRQIKDNGQGYQSLDGVAVDPKDGSIVVTGTGAGDVDFGGGVTKTAPGDHPNVVLARYAKDGAPLASQLVGANGGAQDGAAVALGKNGDIFLTGTFQTHLAFSPVDIMMPMSAMFGTTAIFVARLDSAGKGTWGTAFTPSSFIAKVGGTSVAADEFAVVVGGYFSDVLSNPGLSMPLTSKGGTDGLAMKLAVDQGTLLWTAQFGDMANDQINGVALDPRNVNPLGASAVAGALHGDTNNKYDIFLARLAP